MGKRKTGSSKRPAQHTRHRHNHPGDLMTDVRQKLPTVEPLDFLAYVSALAVLAGDSELVSREITAEAEAAGLAGSQRNGAARASATWTASASSSATTRLSRPAGPSRQVSSRAPAGTSSETVSR